MQKLSTAEQRIADAVAEAEHWRSRYLNMQEQQPQQTQMAQEYAASRQLHMSTIPRYVHSMENGCKEGLPASSSRGQLLLVTNAIQADACRQGDCGCA